MRPRLAVLAPLLLSPACAPAAPAVAPRAVVAPAIAAEPLPAAPLSDLAGKPADLGALAHGRVTLVSFWATWCDACVREMDALNRLSDRTKDRPDALVVGVAVGEAPADVDAFVRRHGLSYAQLVDPEFRLADALGQRRVPATLVVDRQGRIVHRGEALGAGELDAFRRALDARP